MSHTLGLEPYDHRYDVLLVGDLAVGKSALLSRYLKGSLPAIPKPTMSIEGATKIVPLWRGGTVRAQIWDTTGGELYRKITYQLYPRVNSVLLVYDVTRLITFQDCHLWLEELRKRADPDIVIMLVGNKVDLVDQDPGLRQVSRQAGRSLADQYDLFFIETSSYADYNVTKAFKHLMQEVYDKKRLEATLAGGDPLGDTGNVGIASAVKFFLYISPLNLLSLLRHSRAGQAMIKWLPFFSGANGLYKSGMAF